MISIFRRKIYSPGCLIGEYKVIKLIGEGRFGVCYLVDLDGKQYVLKEIKPKAIKKSGNKVIFEQEILSSIDHPSIPKIVDTIKVRDRVLIVEEEDYSSQRWFQLSGNRFESVFIPSSVKTHKNYEKILALIEPLISHNGSKGNIYYYDK